MGIFWGDNQSVHLEAFWNCLRHSALPISIFALARQTENRGAGSIGLRQYLPKYLLQITVNTKYSTPLEYSISDILEHLMQSLWVSHQMTRNKNVKYQIILKLNPRKW